MQAFFEREVKLPFFLPICSIPEFVEGVVGEVEVRKLVDEVGENIAISIDRVIGQSDTESRRRRAAGRSHVLDLRLHQSASANSPWRRGSITQARYTPILDNNALIHYLKLN